MKSEQFLELIGAPWAAYHDHPYPETAPSLAYIRAVGTKYGDDEVCSIYCCEGINGDVQKVRRDLIAQAPRMYQYIASMAAQGDTEAKLILRAIHGEEA